MREGGVAGSQPMITAVHRSPNKNFGDLTPYLTYVVPYFFVQAGLKVQPDALNFLILLRNKTDRFVLPEIQLPAEILHPSFFLPQTLVFRIRDV
jgi:hypothetical protein